MDHTKCLMRSLAEQQKGEGAAIFRRYNKGAALQGRTKSSETDHAEQSPHPASALARKVGHHFDQVCTPGSGPSLSENVARRGHGCRQGETASHKDGQGHEQQ